MKDKRYSAKGATQIIGTGAMFSVKKLVSATIRIEGHAAKSIQVAKWIAVGAGAGSFSTSTRATLLRLRHAKMQQVSTKMAYKADHHYDCHWVGSMGSKAMG